MKLSNTLTINENLLPTSKKAFTLAEVLITLSILGVVAALTIPSLVNRNSDIAAQVKLKKAISNYEDVAAVYMVENEATNISGMMSDGCTEAPNYFKIVSQDDCTFVTADGAEWTFEPGTGFAYVQDSATSPRFGVTLWAMNGQANGVGATDGTGNVPNKLFIPNKSPLHGIFAAAGEKSFLNTKLTQASANKLAGTAQAGVLTGSGSGAGARSITDVTQ